jgi:iron complex transport system ATP-binding protein
LAVAYGARRALDGVDLGLHEGEFVAVLGPNGAGKSTLVKALAGVVRPSAGEAWVRPPRARTLAYLAQAEPPPAHFRARDVVRLGRLPHQRWLGGASEADELAVARALADTATGPLADRRVGELSGGERQRVALARALAQEPAALLLDEPLAHLDVRHQVDLLARLAAQAGRGRCVLAVLHDLGLASYASRCVVLSRGRVLADGPPREALTAETLFAAYGVPFEVTPAPDGGVRASPLVARPAWGGGPPGATEGEAPARAAGATKGEAPGGAAGAKDMNVEMTP